MQAPPPCLPRSGMETSGRDTGGAPHTGTTIVAVQYDGGVVLGADSRVSTGRYVSNRASDKLTPLHDHVWLLRSGSAADTQLVADYGAPADRPWRACASACKPRVSVPVENGCQLINPCAALPCAVLASTCQCAAPLQHCAPRFKSKFCLMLWSPCRLGPL